MEDLIDQMYEAAADERQWLAALQGLDRRLDSRGSWLFVAHKQSVLGAHATGGLRQVTDAAVATLETEADRRAHAAFAWCARNATGGFVHADRYFPPSLWRGDPTLQLAAQERLNNMTAAVLHVPDGLAVLGISSAPGQPMAAAGVGHLNQLHAHWARATQLALHLGRQRARHTSQVLQSLDQPAAVLSQRGAVMACNALFEHLLPDWAVLDAREQVQAHAPGCRAQLSSAVARLHRREAIAPLRVPTHSGRALQVQLLPLVGAARESFMGGQVLLTVQAIEPPPAGEPAAQQALQQRYGLSAKEAQLALLLARGQRVRQAAAALALTHASGRTYLDRIYAKTGVRRQAELVRLVLAGGAPGGDGAR